MNNPYSLMRNYAVEVLVKIGQPAFEPVIKASESKDEVIRRKCCDILGRMGNKEGIKPLIRLLNDPDRYVRRRAAKALTRLGDTSAVLPLIKALQDPEVKVRIRTAEALGNIGDNRAIEPLIKALKDENVSVRAQANISLERIGWIPPEDELGAEYYISRGQWDKCLSIGKPAVNPLINTLTHPDSEVRNSAVQTLADLGDMAFDAILKASRSKDRVFRRKACDVLGIMADPKAISPLTRLLNDRDRYVRRRAAHALINIPDEKAVPSLIKALKDREKKVRSRSALALGNIGDVRAMKPLIKSLKDDSSTVRLSAITALGQLGQPQAVDPITRLLKDRNSRVRYTAQKTLKNQFHLEKRPLTQKRKNKRFTQPNIKETEIYYTKIQSNTQGKNLFCPSCSYPIRKEDNFCQQCGTNIKKCPKCSYPLQTDAKFCTKCGSTLKLELSMKDLERLQKLHDLKNKCILTEEEFKAKKRDILNFND
ncbi:MAG: HEAT repeat domain-containing protein [Methanobacterium sp.]|nr:HEAT repeat domain-containing protein [Methanobacterium sp.]